MNKKTIFAALVIAIFAIGIFLFLKSPSIPTEDEIYISTPSTTEELIFRNSLGLEKLKREDMAYAKIDLNNDGQTEYLTKLTNQSYCGKLGCVHAIFIKEKSRWRVTNAVITHSLVPLNSYTNKYQDLLAENNIKWVWNGHNYAPATK